MTPLRTLSVLALVAGTFALSPTPADAAVPTCQGAPATIVGTPAIDRIIGTPGDDVIVAQNGDDTVLGRGGDDLVCGGDGADVLKGGPGNDRLYGQREAWHSDRGGTYFIADVLDGGPGDDLLDVGGDDRRVDWGLHGSLDYTHAGSGVTVDLAAGTATGPGSDTLRVVPGRTECDYDCAGLEVLGSAYDDVLVGTETSDDLVGNAGDDHLDGHGGNDSLSPDPRSDDGAPAGDDTVAGGPGDDYLYSHDGHDLLFGDDGSDTVWQTEGGPSEVHGGAGDDRVVVAFPRRPGFVLDGGPGIDEAQVLGPGRSGAGGRPTAALVTMSDGLVVASEVDWGHILEVEELGLYAALRWEYEGTDAAEVVFGGGTWLHAATYGGDDEIWGTSAADRIDAGDGNDSVHAGRGRDTCLNAEVARSCERTSREPARPLQ